MDGEPGQPVVVSLAQWHGRVRHLRGHVRRDAWLVTHRQPAQVFRQGQPWAEQDQRAGSAGGIVDNTFHQALYQCIVEKVVNIQQHENAVLRCAQNVAQRLFRLKRLLHPLVVGVDTP